jgi:ElaB/YqjD/DUF883 family membrane-anchored ribosome-binding protein
MEQQIGKIPSSVQEIPGREDTYQVAREKLNETLAGVSEQARTAARYAHDTVHSHPWTSVGVGFGMGVLIGALVMLAASSRRSIY